MDDKKLERIARRIEASVGFKCQYDGGDGAGGIMYCRKYIGTTKNKGAVIIEDALVKKYNYVQDEGGKVLLRVGNGFNNKVYAYFYKTKKREKIGVSKQEYISESTFGWIEDKYVQEYNRFSVPRENEAVNVMIEKTDDGRIYCSFTYTDIDKKGGAEEFADSIGGELVQTTRELYKI